MATPSRPISKRTFQVIALASLPAPGVATYFAAPRVLAAFGDPSGAVSVLVVVLTLLVAVIAWAAVLLPIRRRSAMPTFSEELDSNGVTSFDELFAKARAGHEALANAGADRPDLNRRYHLRMAAGGLVVAVAAGVGTYAMALDASGQFFLAVPIVTASAAVLAAYHMARALIVRVPPARS